MKQIYLVRGKKEESYNLFKERIDSIVKPMAQDNHILNLSYTITEKSPPKVSIIPFKKKKIASITVKKNDEKAIEVITQLQGFEGAYSVTEALPVAYEKTWAEGEKTPGDCLLTLFKQKKNIDYKTFLDRWHNSHTPMSLKYHPLWHYNRNVVDELLTDYSVRWDGIVEEHMRTRSELMNPFKFFGGPLVILQRMLHVYTDTKSFLDYKTVEPYLVVEYHLKG